ncbi:MAG: multifunctional CCA tRNA nucleotidyl transferase/2'3'-cyclic phosphodiesterase/2'nucleotidase/phosphatase [Rhodoferax sp.]
MEIYLVGGAVRDTLLGLPVKDRDWVVVGGTPQQLLAQGYTPVGRDFPVFLHPRTHEQVALARTERKTAPGYQGFAIHAAPDVTLEQDLARRDLTINAIAVPQAHTDAAGNFDPQRATLIDPYGGRADLAARQLRHVTDAFREDPVRILRVARFAARFTEFSVAPDTLALMRAMVAQGEAAALVAERVWQELARGLMEQRPSRMLQVLRACGADGVLLPELFPQSTTVAEVSDRQNADAHLWRVLDHGASVSAPLPLRFACLCLRAPSIQPLCERLRVPADCTALAELAVREHLAVQHCEALDAAGLVQLLERCDAFRRPGRVADLLQVAACDAFAQSGITGSDFIPHRILTAALAASLSVSTAALARRALEQGLRGESIGQMIQAARIAAVRDHRG